MNQDVLIIGGGLAGLASAVELCRAGLSVTVVEKDHLLGGRARSWEDPDTGDTVDIGPHILLSEYHNMLQFLDGLGTRERILWQQEKFITLVGKPRPVDISLRRLPAPLHFLPSLLGLPQVSLRDLASNRYLLWQVMRLTEQDIQHLDTMDAESYLRQMEVSEHFIDWFWRSACITIMNAPLECCSAGALLRFFRFMVGKNDYRVGFADCGLGELYAPAAQAVIESHGGRVLRNCAVSAFEVEEERLRGVYLSDGRRLEASWCIAALPPPALRELVPAAWLEEGAAGAGYFGCLNKVRPSPYVCTYLWFDRKLTQERFWSRVWSPDNLNYDSYDLSNIRRGWEERPSVIASNSIHSFRANALDDGEIVRRTLEELADFLPEVRQARVRHASVHRVPMGVPAPYPGAERLRLPNRTPVEGLLVAGDWTDTGLPSSMESAVCSGYRAAEEVLGALGRPREIHIDPPRTEGLVRLMGGSRT